MLKVLKAMVQNGIAKKQQGFQISAKLSKVINHQCLQGSKQSKYTC